jgi:hypothetical protein
MSSLNGSYHRSLEGSLLHRNLHLSSVLCDQPELQVHSPANEFQMDHSTKGVSVETHHASLSICGHIHASLRMAAACHRPWHEAHIGYRDVSIHGSQDTSIDGTDE